MFNSLKDLVVTGEHLADSGVFQMLLSAFAGYIRQNHVLYQSKEISLEMHSSLGGETFVRDERHLGCI